MTATPTGPFTDPGRRVEHVQWGLRHTASDHFHRRGEVALRPDEQDARRVLEAVKNGEPLGWGAIEVVSHNVVTYTTRWAAA